MRNPLRSGLPRTSQSRTRLGPRPPQSAPRLMAPACSVPEWRRVVGPMSSVDPSTVTQQDDFVQSRMSRHRWASVCPGSRPPQVCGLLRSRPGQDECSTAWAASAHDHPSSSSSASGIHIWTLASCCRLECSSASQALLAGQGGRVRSRGVEATRVSLVRSCVDGTAGLGTRRRLWSRSGRRVPSGVQ